jgi:hypothetical protein
MTKFEKSRRELLLGGVAMAAASLSGTQVLAQQGAPQRFTINELVDNGHRFFGSMSRGLAQVVEEATKRWGQPNAYILGQGQMYTRNAGQQKVFWQGPSLGFDAGADGARTMMLIYNLPSTSGIFRRFGGVDGSAYFVAGFGFTALTADDVIVVPIRAGVGARLGVNLGYLKFTPSSTWNPF